MQVRIASASFSGIGSLHQVQPVGRPQEWAVADQLLPWLTAPTSCPQTTPTPVLRTPNHTRGQRISLDVATHGDFASSTRRAPGWGAGAAPRS
jgi:hypothetical protein